MSSLISIARMGTYDEFLALYDKSPEDPTSLLLRAVGNLTPIDRVKISLRLLDDGADASVVERWDSCNSLHVLFHFRSSDHDYGLEAALLERLLDAGADINLHSLRFGYPLCVMIDTPASEEDLAPWYDIIFSRSELNLDAVIRKDSGYTVRDRLLKNPRRTERVRRVHEHDRKFHGS